jgi:hypothetical protein
MPRSGPARLTTGDLHAVVVDVGAGPVLGGTLEFSDILQVRRAAGRNHRGIQPVGADTGQRFVVEFLRFRPAGLGRVQHEAAESQSLRVRDQTGERNRLRRRLDAGALAAGIALDHHRQRPAGSQRGLREAGDHSRAIGGNRHVGFCL